MVEAFRSRSLAPFLELTAASLARGKFPGARRELREAALAAAVGFCHFVLEALLHAATAGNSDPQVIALLADLGAAPEGVGCAVPVLGPQGGDCLARLALAPGQLRTAVKVAETWHAEDSQLLPPCARQAFAEAIVREVISPFGSSTAGPSSAAAAVAVAASSPSAGQVAAAVAALTAMPWLLDEGAVLDVLLAVDDGSRDDVAEKLAARLPKTAQRHLVERRRAGGRLKSAAKAVKLFALADDFPNVEFEYRTKALENALHHKVREAAVGLTLGEPRLHERCVLGLLDMGEAVLGLELAGCWAVAVPPALFEVAEAAAAAAQAVHLSLPQAYRTCVVDTEPDVQQMRGELVAARLVGFDAEWQQTEAGEAVPSLLQLATVDAAFLVDLMALGSSDVLAAALEAVFCQPHIVKVGFDGFADLTKVSRGFPKLAAACGPGAAGVVDVQGLEVERRVREEGLPKKKAKEKLSLSSLAEAHLGRALDKSLQLCGWSRRPLSHAQVHYAALDAYVCAKIYDQVFRQHRL